MLASRFATFYKSLITCNKLSVRYLARLNEHDNRTLFGRTLGKLVEECNVPNDDTENLTASLVKKEMKYYKVPEEEQWMIPILLELLKQREGSLEISSLTCKEISNIIDYLCIS